MNAARAIAVAQTTPEPGDVAANVGQHVELAQIASELGARVVLYPELSLTGYELELADELAFEERDARLAPLVRTARSLDLHLIVGAPARLDTGLHITAFVLAPDGSIELHTKRRLGAFSPSAHVDGTVPPAEWSIFQAAERQPLITIDDRVTAIAICAETGDPDHVAGAAARGATSYLASMFVIPSELTGDQERLEHYARHHAMVVALANFAGSSGGLEAAGGSSIWSTRGERLVHLERDKPGVAVALELANGWRTRTQQA